MSFDILCHKVKCHNYKTNVTLLLKTNIFASMKIIVDIIVLVI